LTRSRRQRQKQQQQHREKKKNSPGQKLTGAIPSALMDSGGMYNYNYALPAIKIKGKNSAARHEK
jgi:hypothetical protein